jgi:hypothetical protein
MSIQILTVLPNHAAAILQARGLFEEYWASFGFTPCFQNFGAELESLPDRFQAPTGELLLHEVAARARFEQTAPYAENPTPGAIYLRYRL